MSVTGGGNLYPNWLGSASLTVPSNTINTSVTVQGSNYSAAVNIVPQILLSNVSTTTLDTNNPSEVLSYTTPATGWYKTEYQGVGNHASGSNWTSMSQLQWYVKINNSLTSNTLLTVEPQYISGNSVSEYINVFGGGVFYATTGQTLEWTCDADPVGAGPAINTGFNGGFGWITLQKIA